MNRFQLIVMVLLVLMCSYTQAQYVIEPCLEGTVNWRYNQEWNGSMSGGGNTHQSNQYFSSPNEFKVGWACYSTNWGGGGMFGGMYFLSHHQAVVEFELNETTGGTPFPMDLLTAYNFEAFLVGIQAGSIESCNDPNREIELYRLPHEHTDCQLSPDDHDGYYQDYPYITTLWDNVPESFDVLDPIYVTDSLRVSLFGPFGSEKIAFAIDRYEAESCIFSFADIPLVMDGIRLEIFLEGTPAYTPLPTRTPTLTPTPTRTPTPAPPPIIELDLEDTRLHPGESFHLRVAVTGHTNMDEKLPLVVMIELNGTYFFYPTWNTDFSYENVNVYKHKRWFEILDFIWPDTGTTSTDNYVYAALLTFDHQGIYSNVDQVSFGWDG